MSGDWTLTGLPNSSRAAVSKQALRAGLTVHLKAWLRAHPGLRGFLIRLYNVGWNLFPDHDGVPGVHIKRFSEQIGHSRELLEIGGAGLSYARLFSSGHVTCLDLRADPGIQVQGDIYALPFPTMSISTVLLFEVLEHLAEPKAALQEISRVLEPDGRLAVTTPQYWHEHGWPSDYFRYTRHGLRYLAESTGFTVEALTPMGGPALLVSLVLSNNFGLGVDRSADCCSVYHSPGYATFSIERCSKEIWKARTQILEGGQC